MKIVIITNCTNRKRIQRAKPIVLDDTEFASVFDLAGHWKKLLAGQKPTLEASNLYVGRSVNEVKKVADKLNARLMFASTGLGLIDSSDEYPSYNLTANSNSNSILPHLTKLEAKASDWWDAINSLKSTQKSLPCILGSPDVDLVLIALSASYIDLISNDLTKIQNNDVNKLRIFTSRPGIQKLPQHLQKTAMPYDDRLESSLIPGTRSDFPQRALSHFACTLDLSKTDLITARQKVVMAMDELSIITKPLRKRLTDSEISLLLENAWAQYNGSSTKLLRYLRDIALVSCEQSRFKKIWQTLKNSKLAKVTPNV